MNELFEIIHEDADLLLINKPADLVCHPTKGDEYSSLISRVRLHLERTQQPVGPQLINRLDRETSGLVLVAKNPAAALNLRRQWEAGSVEKHYLAIVHGELREEQFVIDAPLGRDETSVVAIKDCVRPDGAQAITEVRRLGSFTRDGARFSLLEVLPRTGRKHQIRIHLAHAGHPIVGDKIYGGDETLYLDFVTGQLTPQRAASLLLSSHALHAGSLRFDWQGEPVRFFAALPAPFTSFVSVELQEFCSPAAHRPILQPPATHRENP